MSSILTTLAQSKQIANAVLKKVKDKGYALSSDLGTLASLNEVAESNLASALASKINGKADAATTISGYGITDAYTKTEVDNAISESQAAVLKPGGSLAAEGIVAGLLVEGNLGKVYNITEDFTTTDSFVEGSGKVHPAGTNIYVVDVSATSTPSYKFDVLAGSYGVATQSGNGLMSASDKTKLDNADVTAYTAGNGISISSHAVSAVVDSTNANGLSVGANGLALAAATTTAAGAMSAADKAKLDDADVTAYTSGDGISISSHAVSAVVDSSNANGLSVGASGIALAAATTTTAGAMSAADKSKLDSADVTAYTSGNGINITNHAVAAVVDTTNANGLSVGTNGIALAAATSSAAGAMSASDKSKLDNADVTAYTGTGAIDVTNHVVSIAAATTSAAGSMSAADKTKLDDIEIATAQQITDMIAELDSL